MKEAEREEARADVVRLVDALPLPLPSPDVDLDWLPLPAAQRAPFSSTPKAKQQETGYASAQDVGIIRARAETCKVVSVMHWHHRLLQGRMQCDRGR